MRSGHRCEVGGLAVLVAMGCEGGTLAPVLGGYLAVV
eukprot:COSAG06_NODE_1571_length_9064_cov_22.348689_11_plen_37_part_00